MSPQIGQVALAGTLAGPESAWPISESALAHAMEMAGAPKNCLRLVRDGGRITIEPSQQGWNSADFGAAPGASIGEVVRELSGGRRIPEEWGSTLRVTHYQSGQKVETLVGFAEDGVHAVGRSQPWQPVPEAKVGHWVQRYGLVAVLLAVAFGGWAWLNWDQLTAYFRGELAHGPAAISEKSATDD